MEKKILIVGITILLLIVGTIGCFDTETEAGDWTWELTVDVENEFTISQSAMDCIGSNNPEFVFASILTKVGVVFQKNQDDMWKSWSYARHLEGFPQTLTSMIPDKVLTVTVSENCVLTIERC